MDERDGAGEEEDEAECVLAATATAHGDGREEKRERDRENPAASGARSSTARDESMPRAVRLACLCASLPLSSHTDRRRVFILFCLIRREEGNCHGVAVCIERGLMLR
jgi:hypothetical protein